MVTTTSASAVKVIVKECGGRTLGTGSGFSIGSYVVTNRHVVEDAERIDLLLPNEVTLDVDRWAIAAGDDLALLKPSSALPIEPVRMAPEDPRSGDLVASVGFPLGEAIKARRAQVLERLDDQDYSQTYAVTTNASVQPGDSGGVLVNATGEVVAITTAIALKENVSIAVPVSRLRDLISTANFSFSSDSCR